jgi:hypothetical protein
VKNNFEKFVKIAWFCIGVGAGALIVCLKILSSSKIGLKQRDAHFFISAFFIEN